MRARIIQQLAALARFYAPLFGGRNLIITNTVSSGFLLGTADIVQQALERRQNPTRKWDVDRAAHMFITGCSMGPLLHYWYFLVDKITPRKGLEHFKVVVIKVMIDQSFAPFFGCWYFTMMGLLQGHSLADSLKEFREKFWDYYLAELTLWPAAQMVNFLFLPPHYRVLFVNVVTLGWNMYLSYLKHRN
ncbi:mpv17-like protein 2 [Rhineura floridana]|uniref:mpv17-like protein 2 n=1 Tax=Rhineura floridana TaxID=261503 RepID=UPI002AC87AEE|nr:mpv17-like protein 2 [Rhineura floridana]